MNTWTQKNLDALAAALQMHLTATSWNVEHGYVLIDAQKRAHAASLHPQLDDKALSEVRLTVCSVCRKNLLYKCDVHDGWSPNCALIRSNM